MILSSMETYAGKILPISDACAERMGPIGPFGRPFLSRPTERTENTRRDGASERWMPCAGQTSNSFQLSQLSASASGRHLRSTASGFSLGGSDRLTSHSSNSKMRILRSLALLAGIAATATDAVSVGDAIPSNIDLHFGFPPEMINVGERVAKKKVIIVGLPGAFTPT